MVCAWVVIVVFSCGFCCFVVGCSLACVAITFAGWGWFIRLRVGLVLRFVGVVWLLMFAFCVRLGLIVFGGGLICWCGLLMCLVLLVWLIDVGSLVGLA